MAQTPNLVSGLLPYTPPTTGGSTTQAYSFPTSSFGSTTGLNPVAKVGTSTTPAIPSTTDWAAPTTGLVSAPKTATTATNMSGGIPNMTTSTGQAGNLAGLGSGQVFTFGGLQYIKGADGSIKPYNAPNTGTQQTNTPPPQNNSPVIPPGNTTNAQGGTVPIPNNVATGGGTQTNFPSIVGGLASTASQPSQQYTDAQKQYLAANAELQKLQNQAAIQTANIGGSRTNLAEAGGEQGLLQNLVANQSAALTGEMNAAQAAAQTATGQQGTQQSGLAAAGGLAAPQAFGLTNIPFNPITGQFGGIAGAGAGGIGGAGQVMGQLGSSENFYQNLVPAFNQAQSVYQGLTSFIQQNPSINPTDANFVNNMNAWARGQQLSDPKYNQFTQYLNELLQTLTPIIGSQGVSDYKSQLVQTMVNPTSSTQSIQAQVQNLMNIAQGKMTATQQSFTSSQPFNTNTGTSNTGSLWSW